MAQSPLDPPNDPTSSRETNLSGQRPSSGSSSDDRTTGPSRPLTFDEVVALFVAFLSLGSVLLWGLTRGGLGLFSETLAGADTSLLSPQEGESAAPFAFNLGGADEDADEEGPNALLATPETEESATVSPDSAADDPAVVATEQEPARRGVWDNVKAGMAGAATGITGVALTPDETAAAEAPEIAEPDPFPPVAADSAAAPLSAAAKAQPKDAIQFDDVPENYWAKPYIDALSSRDLISGFEEGDFKPDQPVTRAQIANIVSRTFDLTADKENLEFSDVEGDYWARESIGEVVKGGFMTGFPNDTFAPNDPVTRAQALTTLVTGLGITPPTNVQTSLDRYADANTIPNWATGKVAAATSGGLVVNYPTLEQLNPTQPTTRAELSAFIYQALVKEKIVDPVESEYLVKPVTP